MSISLKGHDSYGNDVGQWREGQHDDLVLAVALAAWYGEHYRPVVDNTPPTLFEVLGAEALKSKAQKTPLISSCSE